jgi:calcineurin-like phosphoesterase family protein
MIWFTSDTHYGHANIIDFCDRPYSGVPQMNKALIDNWNDRVDDDDVVYHLGDFAMKIKDDEIRHILRQLKGIKVIILGNHDARTIARKSSAFRRSPEFPEGFDEIHPGVHEISVGKQKIVLCHYSMEVWNGSHKGAFHLYGHSHGTLAERVDRRSFDVGVDAQEYAPISFDAAVRRMEKKKWKPIDHHDERR